MFKLISPDTGRAITFKRRRDNWFMWLVGAGYWTTIGDTIFYPDGVDDPLDPRWWLTIQHELVHHKQQTGHNLKLWLARYIIDPYFRWRMEREAYAVNIQHGASIDWVVSCLKKYYCWPASSMRQWFEQNCKPYNFAQNAGLKEIGQVNA